MTTDNKNNDTAIRLAELRTEMHALARDIARIASVVEKTQGELKTEVTELRKELHALKMDRARLYGALAVLGFVWPIVLRKLGWL